MEGRLAELLGEPAYEAVVVTASAADAPAHTTREGRTPGLEDMARAIREHCGYLYLVAGPTRVALFPFQGGGIRSVRGPALFVCPRESIVAAETHDRGLAVAVDVRVCGGLELKLEVPRSQASRLHRVLQYLGMAA